MRAVHICAVIGLGLTVSACSDAEITSRNAPFEALPGETTMAGLAPVEVEYPQASTVTAAAHSMSMTDLGVEIAAGEAPVHVNSITVDVPHELKVSEANSYYPGGDIVWRGDPIGNRHAQVKKIFEDAIAQGVAPMDGPVGVDLAIEVKRFHAITEKARYTTGGNHSITFDLAITDSSNGELVVPVRTIEADLDAFGGRQAVLADARGDTQKVRISRHLAEVIRQELTNPEGYKNANLGFYQLLNRL